MINDHMYFLEHTDIYTGKNVIQGTYYLIEKRECDIAESDIDKNLIKLGMIRSFKKQMIEDLSGYFNDSLTDEDVNYLSNMTCENLQKIRNLDELTKNISVEQVQKILSAYAILVDLGFASKESTND